MKPYYVLRCAAEKSKNIRNSLYYPQFTLSSFCFPAYRRTPVQGFCGFNGFAGVRDHIPPLAEQIFITGLF